MPPAGSLPEYVVLGPRCRSRTLAFSPRYSGFSITERGPWNETIFQGILLLCQMMKILTSLEGPRGSQRTHQLLDIATFKKDIASYSANALQVARCIHSTLCSNSWGLIRSHVTLCMRFPLSLSLFQKKKALPVILAQAKSAATTMAV